MESPDISLIYNEHLPCELFDEFKKSVDNDKLTILVESR